MKNGMYSLIVLQKNVASQTMTIGVHRRYGTGVFLNHRPYVLLEAESFFSRWHVGFPLNLIGCALDSVEDTELKILILGGEAGGVVNSIKDYCNSDLIETGARSVANGKLNIENIAVYQKIFIKSIRECAEEYPSFRLENKDIYRDKGFKVINIEEKTSGFLKNHQNFFDLILFDLPLPVHEKAGEYFTTEFLTICRNSLNKNGMLHVKSQWEPYIIPTIHSTMLEVFQNTLLSSVSYTERSFSAAFFLGSKVQLSVNNIIKIKEEFSSFKFPVGISLPDAESSSGRVHNNSNGRLIADTLLSRLDPFKHMSYPYASDTLLMEPSSQPLSLLSRQEQLSLLKILNNTYNIVWYHPSIEKPDKELLENEFKPLHGLTEVWFDFYDEKVREKMINSFERLKPYLKGIRSEDMWTRACDHKGLEELLSEYLLNHKTIFFDGLGSPKSAFEHLAHYYYHEKEDGTPLGFVKTLCWENGREAEIIYCRGTSRQNTAMFLHDFRIEMDLGHQYLSIFMPSSKEYAHVIKTQLSLGGKRGFSGIVYVSRYKEDLELKE